MLDHRLNSLTGIGRSVWERAIGAASRVLLGAGLVAGLGDAAVAQIYGPRQWGLVPKGTQVPLVTGSYTEGNVILDDGVVYPGLTIESSVVFPSYVRFFDLAGRASQFMVGVPYVYSEAKIKGDGIKARRSISGLADLYTHLAVGLVNTPSLEGPEYVKYMTETNPGVIAYGLLGVTPPTGKYDSDRILNLGTNRWTFRAGLPTTIRLSPTWEPGKTTTLELIPTVDIFTPNFNPPLSSRVTEDGIRLGDTDLIPNRTSQKPIGSLEAHLTHDLSEKVWVSLDFIASAGGETANDSVDQDNSQAWAGLGGTIGLTPWQGGRLSVGGGSVVAGNDNSFDAWQVVVQFQQAF